jgi:hypothetical protein
VSNVYRANLETMRTLDFLRLIEGADAVLTEPTSPEWFEQIAYGKAAFLEVVHGNKNREMKLLHLQIDWQSEEPELLSAIIMKVKGSCDLFKPAEMNRASFKELVSLIPWPIQEGRAS